MMTSEDRSRSRFDLVTAGHHFLLSALPLRHPETTVALEMFVERANRSQLADAEKDAVLLRVLCVVDRQTGGRLPTLVDQYLCETHEEAECVARFAACVRRVLSSGAIHDPRIRQAVAIIDRRHTNPRLSLRAVAEDIGVAVSTLAKQFKTGTGQTFTEYLRGRRLDRSADLLIATNMTVKETWAAVGYNHASNFDHDFKRRFDMSPREYRARAVRGAHAPHAAADGRAIAAAPRRRIDEKHRVLVVDDDDGTQATLGRFLRLQGYDVSLASGAAEALQIIDEVRLDAMLIDYRLPDMDGVAVLRALRRRQPELPRAALFTADWDVYDREAEISRLHAIIASKICDLDDIDTLVAYLVN
jgi:AraC-like DNA-binding protein/CheY-like chemotaxis protein